MAVKFGDLKIGAKIRFNSDAYYGFGDEDGTIECLLPKSETFTVKESLNHVFALNMVEKVIENPVSDNLILPCAVSTKDNLNLSFESGCLCVRVTEYPEECAVLLSENSIKELRAFLKKHFRKDGTRKGGTK